MFMTHHVIEISLFFIAFIFQVLFFSYTVQWQNPSPANFWAHMLVLHSPIQWKTFSLVHYIKYQTMTTYTYYVEFVDPARGPKISMTRFPNQCGLARFYTILYFRTMFILKRGIIQMFL